MTTTTMTTTTTQSSLANAHDFAKRRPLRFPFYVAKKFRVLPIFALVTSIILIAAISFRRNDVTETASSARQVRSSFAVEEWYRDILQNESSTCMHTYPFFHYFLPHKKCNKPKRIGNCNDGAKWICLDLFVARTTARAKHANEKCVVYSFGSSKDSCFESAMAESFDCEIHIFDPTSPELKDDRWTYHSYGLGGKDVSITQYWDWRTQSPANCVACTMKNLNDIMKELGHTYLDVLKVDVDGAEWRSFEYIYDLMKTLPADQLQVELTGLDVTPKADSLAGGLAGAHKWWVNILQDNFHIFHLETNPGTCTYRGKERGTSTEYALWRGF